MILRSVEGIEAEPFRFHLGGLGHSESNLAEDGNHFAAGGRKGVQGTGTVGDWGQRGVVSLP